MWLGQDDGDSQNVQERQGNQLGNCNKQHKYYIKSKAIKLKQLHKYPVPKIVENYIKEHITIEVY